MKVAILSVCCLLLLPQTGFTQKPPAFPLTVDSIMRGYQLTGYAPRNVRWSADGKRLFFDWKLAKDAEEAPYGHYGANADGTDVRPLTETEVGAIPPAFGAPSPDKRYLVYSEEGDIVVYDRQTGNKRQVTATSDWESNPRFSNDGKTIYFSRDGNAFAVSLTDASLRQLTELRSGNPPSPAPPATGTSQDALRKTELELFDSIRGDLKQREENEARRKREERRKPTYLGANQQVASVEVAPDGATIAVLVRSGGDNGKLTVVPRYVTESGYTEAPPGRPKVGDGRGGSTRAALLNPTTGELTYLDFTAPEIKAEGVKPGPRRLSWFGWQWAPDSRHAIVFARTDDNKDAWVFSVDPATKKAMPLVSHHDDAWIGGPGWTTVGFLPDNQRVYYVSEQDGFAHLYTVPVEGGNASQLTKGPFEVYDVRLSADGSHFYYGAGLPNQTERYLYSLPVDGGAPTRITRISDGDDDTVVLSPDERSLALVWSASNHPPELFVMPNRTNAYASPLQATETVQITHSPTAEWLSYNWIAPKIVSYPARDGKSVTARFFKSAKWKAGGPAVIFVHGAGYLQNVHTWWSHYFREYMFHHLLMERGFLVLDVDYRGSAGRGRDWRTGIYRHMGGKDLDDVVDGAKWLATTQGVNPRHIGIYGGSYGGFLTLMALFTAPDVFAAGAALRPVTDWAHYNEGYTANILNEPQNDPDAYRRSSPIYFAGGLKGALLICHGMVDDNVHFQDSVRLAQRLIELRKENWELAAYPVESHGFTEPTSWADEYRRILRLFERNLR